MTQTELDKIYQETTRCTQAVMLAFGIRGYPHFVSGCLEYLTANGYVLTPVKNKLKNLRHFLEEIRSHRQIAGNYLIITPGHAMVIVDGFLVDSAKQGWNSRRIENIWLVELPSAIEKLKYEVLKGQNA